MPASSRHALAIQVSRRFHIFFPMPRASKLLSISSASYQHGIKPVSVSRPRPYLSSLCISQKLGLDVGGDVCREHTTAPTHFPRIADNLFLGIKTVDNHQNLLPEGRIIAM